MNKQSFKEIFEKPTMVGTSNSNLCLLSGPGFESWLALEYEINLVGRGIPHFVCTHCPQRRLVIAFGRDYFIPICQQKKKKYLKFHSVIQSSGPKTIKSIYFLCSAHIICNWSKTFKSQIEKEILKKKKTKSIKRNLITIKQPLTLKS